MHSLQDRGERELNENVSFNMDIVLCNESVPYLRPAAVVVASNLNWQQVEYTYFLEDAAPRWQDEVEIWLRSVRSGCGFVAVCQFVRSWLSLLALIPSDETFWYGRGTQYGAIHSFVAIGCSCFTCIVARPVFKGIWVSMNHISLLSSHCSVNRII